MNLKRKLLALLATILTVAIAITVYWANGKSIIVIDEAIVELFSRMYNLEPNTVMIYPDGPFVDFYSYDWQPGDMFAFPDGTVYMIFPDE